MFELVASVFMLASVFYGQPASASDEIALNGAKTVGPKTIEEVVREHFAETPVLIEVARCESTFRQVDHRGEVIRGRHNEYDVGLMQINELYHSDKAKSLKF